MEMWSWEASVPSSHLPFHNFVGKLHIDLIVSRYLINANVNEFISSATIIRRRSPDINKCSENRYGGVFVYSK